MKQSKLKPKLKVRECGVADWEVTCEPVGPPLLPENAAGRFILIPREEFAGEDDVGGWVGAIVKVDRTHQKLTKVRLNGSEGGSVSWFPFAYVAEHFKPLS